MITGQGLLIIVAGFFEVFTGQEPVRFTVVAGPEIETTIPFVNPEIKANGDDLTFVVSAEMLALNTKNIAREEADSILKLVNQLNAQNGFIAPEIDTPKTDEPDDVVIVDESEASQIVPEMPVVVKREGGILERWLRKKFGPKIDPDLDLDALQGNITILGVRLSGPPTDQDELVLNTGFKSGDSNLKLVRGERLVFNNENWQNTAYLAIQVDPRLDRPATALFEGQSGNIPLAWSITFFILAGLFFVFMIYHKFIFPRPAADKAVIGESGQSPVIEFLRTFALFFRKKGIWAALGFLLLFRLGEAQLVKMAAPFLLDAREIGGLGLTTGEVGIIYGTIGILALTLGGILGGLMASKKGLKFWILPMTLAINLPNLMYVYLSYATPTEFWLISGSVAIEQFGYGFGFTAYMLFMIYFSEGKHKTAHFAICTGFMALGMMLPGMFSGWLQEIIGYQNFFVWVMLCTIPGFLILRFLKIDKSFGVKKVEAKNE
jgi:PAT family beta-lactamase induction signal transducer AmpG